MSCDAMEGGGGLLEQHCTTAEWIRGLSSWLITLFRCNGQVMKLELSWESFALLCRLVQPVLQIPHLQELHLPTLDSIGKPAPADATARPPWPAKYRHHILLCALGILCLGSKNASNEVTQHEVSRGSRTGTDSAVLYCTY